MNSPSTRSLLKSAVFITACQLNENGKRTTRKNTLKKIRPAVEWFRKARRGTRKGNDSVASNSRSTRFYVRDETGTILVDPEGANIDIEQVLDRFEPGSSASRGNISFGGRSFSIGGSRDSGRRRTLGYHFKEWVLPLNRRVYILGAASDRSGELMVQKPRENGKFFISLKSEEELVASAKSGMTWGLYGAIACFIIGAVLIIVQFMR